jgi:hypothetical protein
MKRTRRKQRTVGLTTEGEGVAGGRGGCPNGGDSKGRRRRRNCGAHHRPNSVGGAHMVVPGQAPMGSSGSQTWPGVDEFGGARPSLTPRGRLTTR